MNVNNKAVAEVQALRRRRLHHADHVDRAGNGLITHSSRHLQTLRQSACKTMGISSL